MLVVIDSVLQVFTYGELGWLSGGVPKGVDKLDIQSAGPNPLSPSAVRREVPRKAPGAAGGGPTCPGGSFLGDRPR